MIIGIKNIEESYGNVHYISMKIESINSFTFGINIVCILTIQSYSHILRRQNSKNIPAFLNNFLEKNFN